MDVFEAARRRAAAGEPYVLATVVRCTPPASARPGAKAVIGADGAFDGWVGGSCAQPVVLHEARQALAAGAPRLLRLGGAPSGAAPDDGVMEYPMTCHSGGALEIFLEPVLPAPRLIAIGDSPICAALAELGRVLGYETHLLGADAGSALAAGAAALRTIASGATDRIFVVVATMGVDDEAVLTAALASEADYVALVASPKRAAVVRDYLRASGVPVDRVERLKAPAGLDLGAQTPEEIALSILAEIVQTRAGRARATQATSPPADAPAAPTTAEAIDPVCGMTVTIAGARHKAEHDGRVYYFCCPGC
ncbi:MAG TPA: XdhC family protein, partial [Thermomicrobiales bacterium]|nr:XdhC family protein [Thermomicrobiales bacterium]